MKRSIIVEEYELARQDADHWTRLLVEVDYRDWSSFRGYCISARVQEARRPEPETDPTYVLCVENPRLSQFAYIEPASRFSQKRLEKIAELAKGSELYAKVVAAAKAARGF